MVPPVTAPHLQEPVLSELYSPSRIFSWNELQGMAFDGILLPLYGMSYASPGVAVTHRLRARAAALTVPERIRTKVVAGRLTAAWIYGCAKAPEHLSLLVDAKHRISSLRGSTACSLHEVRLGQMDVVSLGGMLVSSPLRTAADIALHVEADRALPVLKRLLAREELGIKLRLLILAVEATPRVPHKRRALATLAQLASSEPF
ncbi:hypothetical protein [Paenarthrobacter aurescens]|uniref:AbiEi antitoxin C-terminal domain-containing protein n=1 Tax=Paenarthrobacter aurescens TaxID=43663 RepID=A0A4Y3NJW3_PAEAU|nr:hypothetical protein [Paenarthrobacter aurescens]MDO6143734.1 hypothetical protein [Paenarthrobacter aurescens]MDO6147582.1 hypothetical protein [Paenarthrobacter aurescens]MDO6158825.1 hypothetical protein [Paenarthrobacter aurescens]MDO6162809.1 hypothetical protein [Paenarthrobacter aurescens]GEB19388.1 hypothetical protein AAU01_21430 [Paenarthrobacter aurescens]